MHVLVIGFFCYCYNFVSSVSASLSKDKQGATTNGKTRNNVYANELLILVCISPLSCLNVLFFTPSYVDKDRKQLEKPFENRLLLFLACKK